MSRSTILLARGGGVFIIVLIAALMTRGAYVISSTVANEPVMLAYAIISLAIGVAMIVGHNVWSGGLLPVVVSLVGWLIFMKGVVLLLLPGEALSLALGQMHYNGHFYLYLAPSFVLGLYLAWAGFTTPIRDR